MDINPPTNGKAITSMVLGIVGWGIQAIAFLLSLFTLGIAAICLLPLSCLTPIAWLVGVIFGHIALGEIRRSEQPGRGIAIAGLVMGYLGLFATLVLLVILILAIAIGLSVPLLDPYINQLSVGVD